MKLFITCYSLQLNKRVVTECDIPVLKIIPIINPVITRTRDNEIISFIRTNDVAKIL